MKNVILLCWFVATLLLGSAASAAEAIVAVASNFAGPLRSLADAFTAKTGHRLVVTSGATGKLYAQIQNGAPFDVFLSADESTARALEQSGLAVPGSRFPYAFGKLALYSAKLGYVDSAGAVLRSGNFKHLAIANPKVAPYGAAAIETLTKLDLLGGVRPKLVQGENIAQAMQFVTSGNAELGFVAWSQVLSSGKPRPGSYWLVPETLYAPLRQDAVVLQRGAKNPAASAFVAYLASSEARRRIADSGYGLPPLPSDTPNGSAVRPRE